MADANQGPSLRPRVRPIPNHITGNRFLLIKTKRKWSPTDCALDSTSNLRRVVWNILSKISLYTLLILTPFDSYTLMEKKGNQGN